MHGEKRQELGRPERFLMRVTGGRWEAQGIRIVSHGRGNPGTEVDRTLHAAHVNPEPHVSRAIASADWGVLGGSSRLRGRNRRVPRNHASVRIAPEPSALPWTRCWLFWPWSTTHVASLRRRCTPWRRSAPSWDLRRLAGRRMGWRAPPGGRPRRRGSRRFWTCPRGFRPTLRVGASLPGSTLRVSSRPWSPG